MQLLRTIFIIVLAYYIIRFVARYILPWIAKLMIKRTFKNMEQQQRPSSAKKKEGEINIDYQPDRKAMTKDLGEYVDYEEIKE